MADLRIVDAPVLLQESITDDVKMPTGGLGNYAIRLGDLAWYVVAKENLASKSYVDNSSKGVQDKLDIHVSAKDNPHQVTKEQVGLGNVDNTADIDKPISNAIKSALLYKADKVDTYTKSETDNKISTLSSTTYAGHKGYLTLADAQAGQANLLANTLVEVTNDMVENNNGVYLWDGTTLTKSYYDPINYVRNNIKSFMGIKTGANIADISKAEIGYFYSYENGIKTPLNNNFYALLVEVKPSTEYRTNNDYADQFAFLDANQKYISGLTEVEQYTGKFTTPSNCKYVGFTVSANKLSSFIVAEAANYPIDYEQYYEQLTGLKLKTSDIIDFNDKINALFNASSINLIDKSKIKAGYYVGYVDGLDAQVSGYNILGKYEIKPNTTYKFSDNYHSQFAFYDTNQKYVSGLNNTQVFTTPSNAKYIRLSATDAELNGLVLAELSKYPATYEPYKLRLNQTVINKIIVSADVNDSDINVKFKGKNAIQQASDSITDASSTNRYQIIVKQGLYKVDKASDFIGYPGYPSMVYPKDYVDIVGQGKERTVVWAELPYDDAQIGVSVDGNVYPRMQYQTLYNAARDMTISDITFVGKNLRYVNHQDNPNGIDTTRHYRNVDFIFKGDKGTTTALGTGTFNGEVTKLSNGRLFSDKGQAFATHNNVNFTKPSGWVFNNYEFGSGEAKSAIDVQNDGSLINDTIELNGCSLTGASYAIDYYDVWINATDSHFNHAEWLLTGSNNAPFLFNNKLRGGYALVFTTTGKGVSQSIRFDTSSSAYPLLIKSNHGNSGNALFTNSRYYVDDYIVMDGSVDMSAKAWGCVDVYPDTYNMTGVNNTNMTKRLGNLTANPKQLVVYVNGVANTITFNKDYTNMDASQILTEMTAQLSGATADWVNYGKEYYPTMPDVTEIAYNNGTTYIAKGSVVTKQGGFVKLANANDKVFGVALDDIPVMQTLADGEKRGSGRVLKRGYIATNGDAHWVLADNRSPTVGTRFAVSNGRLVTDANGKISVDVDTSIVSINC